MKTKSRNKLILTARKAVTAAKVLIVVAGSAAIVLFSWRYFRYSLSYNLKNIEVKGNRALTKDEVIKASGLVKGGNLFTVRLKDTRNSLKKVNRIDTIEIVKNYPDTIVIEVEERVPVARLALSGNPPEERLVDADGVVFSGVRKDLARIVNTIDREELRNIAAFLLAIKAQDQRFYLKVTEVDGAENEELRLMHDGTRIIWGKPEKNLEKKLDDLKKVMGDLARRKIKPQYIDMRFWEEKKRDITVK